MTVPSDETLHLVVIEPQLFGCLQVFLNVPPVANGPNHLLQRRCRWGKHQIRGFFVWIIDATTDQEPMVSVDDSPMHHRQTCPIKQTRAFGAPSSWKAAASPVL